MTHHICRFFSAVALCAACGAAPGDTQSVASDPDGLGPVVFTSREISAAATECADEGSQCARVEVATIATSAGGTEVVRESIDMFITHDLIARLRSVVPDEVGNRCTTAEELIAAFLGEHRAFITDFPDATAIWSIEITSEAVYNTATVCTIGISETASTGGAHPNSARRLVSFDVATGQLLGVDDLTTDVSALTALAERHLRSDQGLAPEADLETAGFRLGDEGLILPDNIGVVADGILIHWDPYVIAPYSMGSFDVVIPAAELDTIVDARFWEDSSALRSRR